MPVIALGVTGHRILAHKEKILAGVEQAVERILQTYPDAGFRVLSCLAEGADRLLAERLLLLPGAHLWVPLPLPEEEYLRDFKSAGSKEEFHRLLGKAEKVIPPPARRTRAERYLAAGKTILENCDILLAIWDGKAARGRGGTAEIIALGRERGLPMVWIHAGNRLPGTNLPASLGAGQGRVTYEYFPGEDRQA